MSRSDLVYEFAVIGGGLIGSSAARHLSGLSPGGGPVCLIGPADNEATHGAWFDEGRITRGVDNNPYWTALYLPAIERYREIEALSGIEFYAECGHLQVVTGAFANDVRFAHEREGSWPKSRHNKGGCVNSMLQISGQGGGIKKFHKVLNIIYERSRRGMRETFHGPERVQEPETSREECPDD